MYIETRVKGIVEKLIKKYGTSDPKQIVDNMINVSFAYEPLTDNLNGYYFYISEKRQIIRVDENLNDFEKQYATFHELGHKVFDHQGEVMFDIKSTISNQKEEYEADLFATYFFIRHNGINRHNIDNYTIPYRAKRFMGKFL